MDIITELTTTLALMELPHPVRIYLLDHLANIEYNLSNGCSEKLQLGHLVGIFKTALELAK